MPMQRRLTITEVRAIRMARGTQTTSELAMRFGRSTALINQIQHGKAYGNVPWTDAENRLLLTPLGEVRNAGKPRRPRDDEATQLLVLIARAQAIVYGSNNPIIRGYGQAFDIMYDAIKRDHPPHSPPE